jgi:hypothetical protein
VALPALVVLALVAVVGIASTGSTPGGTDDTRPPSESLLDTLFSLWLVAIAISGLVFLYGLTQRKAIAVEVASGRYRRTGLVAWVVFVGVFTVLAYRGLTHWTPTPSEAEEFAFPSPVPTDATPEAGQGASYEPSVSWLPIAAVVALVVAAFVAYLIAERRAQRAPRRLADLAKQLEAALDESLDDLRAEADPRKAIIAAYARLERVLAANGVSRRAAETPDEYLPRVLRDLELSPSAIERLTALFTRAKFSQHAVDTAMKEEAIGALEEVRDELRLARERPAEDDVAMPAVGVGT